MGGLVYCWARWSGLLYLCSGSALRLGGVCSSCGRCGLRGWVAWSTSGGGLPRLGYLVSSTGARGLGVRVYARRGVARGGSHTGKLTPHYHIAQQHPARRRSETNVVISWPVALRHGAIAPQTLPREGEGSLPRRLVSVKMSWAGAAAEGEAVKLSVLWHCPTAALLQFQCLRKPRTEFPTLP